MRTVSLLVVVLLLNWSDRLGAQEAPAPGVLPVSATGAPPRYEAVIIVPEVEVRGRPSPTFYATSKLRQGDRVIVRDEKDGWLAIDPPAGSFSWIKGVFIKRNTDQTATVHEENEVRIGSSIEREPPTVWQVRVQPGTQVILLGQPMQADDGTWWPIKPPPAEVRYIPVEAVRSRPADPTAAPAVPGTGAIVAVNPPNLMAAAPPGQPIPSGMNPELVNAERAEQLGQIELAERMYTNLLQQPTTDQETRVRCQNRLNSLREATRTAQLPRATETNYPPATTASRITTAPNPPPPAVVASMPPALVTSTPVYAPASTVPAAPATPANTSQWVGPGRLRRAPFFVNNKQMYALEDESGRPLYYVQTDAGLNLENYVNRRLQLYGAITYQGQLRNYHVLVSQVQPLPNN